MVLVNITLFISDGENIFPSTSWPFGCFLLIKVHSDIKSSFEHSGHEVLVGWTLVPVLSHSEARVLTALCYLSCTETYLVNKISFLLLWTAFRGLSLKFFACINALKSFSCIFL